MFGARGRLKCPWSPWHRRGCSYSYKAGLRLGVKGTVREGEGEGGRRHGPAHLGTGLDSAAVRVRTEEDGLSEQYRWGWGLLGGIETAYLPPSGPLCGWASPPCRPAWYSSGIFAKSPVPSGSIPKARQGLVSSPVPAQAASPWELMNGNTPPCATTLSSRHSASWKGVGVDLCSGRLPEHQ